MPGYIIKQVLLAILHIYYIFPIRNMKILFISFGGKQYSCNPKYIYEYLIAHEKNRYEYIWCFTNDVCCDGISQYCKSNILLHIFHILTAKIIITNDYIESYIPFRKKQIILNTWHGGGAYKKSGLDLKISYFKQFNEHWMCRKITYFLSSSREFSKVMHSAFNLSDHKMLDFGMPRNDIFFTERFDILKKIYCKYNILETTGIVLFAPTFRGAVYSESAPALNDVPGILDSLSKRFNKRFVLIVRTHHAAMRTVMDCDNTSIIIDGNAHDDMQELLYASDILITDYSSCIWDCCVARKVLFLYTPDIDEYDTERGFYIPPQDWGFPLAKTTDELIKNISEFDYDRHKQAIFSHSALMNSYETGAATKKCAILINDLMTVT